MSTVRYVNESNESFYLPNAGNASVLFKPGDSRTDPFWERYVPPLTKVVEEKEEKEDEVEVQEDPVEEPEDTTEDPVVEDETVPEEEEQEDQESEQSNKATFFEVDDGSEVDKEWLMDHYKDELISWCEELGLDTDGIKDDLSDRLLNYFETS